MDAYMATYRTKRKKTAAEKASRLMRNPNVVAEIRRLQTKVEVKVLLTLNDRLGILAKIATGRSTRPNEKTRAVEVYSKISGDQAPDRHELAGVGGAPIQMVIEQPISERFTVKEKLARLVARRMAATDPVRSP